MEDDNLNDAFIVSISIFFFLTLLSSVITFTKIRNPGKKKPQLPPGSLGWPYIGETLQLYSQDPNIFLSTRHQRYGEIFKTHILGCRCVMLGSPDAARFVLITHAHMFRPVYPRSKENLIGPWAVFFHEGEYHLRLRRVVHGALGPAALRRRLVPEIDALAEGALSCWADEGGVVNTFDHMKKVSFEVGILATFGELEDYYKQELKKNYIIVDRGYNSFTTNLPGTRYQKARKARKRLGEILSTIMRERREERKVFHAKNLLDCLLTSKNGELSDDQIADNIIGVLFAAQDTTASALTWMLKYLHDNPKIFETVKAEQLPVYKSNCNRKSRLTWSQTRNMPYAHKVILESLRMASVISFTFREAVADVHYKGYLIPKGWKVMPLFRNIHYNPDFFADPHKFDPTRFQDRVKGNTFMAFGSGMHACPGNELAKLEMLVFLHHISTHFRYELVGNGSGVQYGPFPVPLHGLPAKFWHGQEILAEPSSHI